MSFSKAFGVLKTIVRLMRFRNVVISFLGVYVGALVFSLSEPIAGYQILKAALSASIILGAGNTLNDYFDYEIDRINRPKRALPANKISKSDAIVFYRSESNSYENRLSSGPDLCKKS